MTEYFKGTSGKNIAYNKIIGSSPGLVFLGGFMSDMEGSKAMFLESYAKETGQGYLRFDYSGHGRSSGKFSDGTIGQWFTDAVDAIDTLTDGPQILIGSSMGGWIALLIAKKLPKLVGGIVTIAGAPDFTEDSIWKNLSIDEKEKLRIGELLIPSEYGEPYIITKELINEGRLNLVLREPLDFQVPVRVLQGTADISVEVKTAIRLFNHINAKDIELILLKGEDHRFSSDQGLSLISAQFHFYSK
tara:strand:- start:134 stop:868 length:735 start_codon:yes stop_codon:yes gene_type:complete